MRKLTRLLAGAASVAAAAALVAGTTVTSAHADPIGNNGRSVVPQSYDVVGVGSDTIEYLLDQLSVDYNSSHTVHNAANPYIYSWDATPPSNPSNTTSKIIAKAGCFTRTSPQGILRPDGSSAGITALDNNTFDTVGTRPYHYCIDFARSSRARTSTDPKEASGGIIFVPLAQDGVTYAVRSARSGGTNAPANLTTADLKAIYTCASNARNWTAFGGKNGTIKPFLPQTGSGTR
jgi:ABC-type phosphate transport system substrate-binding protein